MGKTYITKLTNCISLVERPYSCNGNDFTEVFIYNESNNMIEYIGTSYEDMQYYFNKNYIVFVKNEDVEFAFDNKRFCFITNEVLKLKAFNRILKNSIVDCTKEESNLEIEKAEKHLIKKYFVKK